MADEQKLISCEQLCRDLLEMAIDEGLVLMARDSDFVSGEAHPQARTACDLAGMANHVQQFLRTRRRARDATP